MLRPVTTKKFKRQKGQKSQKEQKKLLKTLQKPSTVDPELLGINQLLCLDPYCDIAAVSDSLDSLPDKSSGAAAATHLIPTDATAFVVKFSKHNEVCNTRHGNYISVGAVSGGSRDPPSRFLHPCVNAPACPMTFKVLGHRDQHGKVCDPTGSARAAFAFACTVEGCGMRNARNKGLQEQHISKLHDWVFVGCQEPRCDPTDLILTQREICGPSVTIPSGMVANELPRSPDASLPRFLS